MKQQALHLLDLDEDTFITRFGPKPNHLDLSAGFDWGDGGCLFNVTGKEFKHVLAQNPKTIWTVLEGDEGQLFIDSGLHIVNRLGYIVTSNPVEDSAGYSVRLD